MVQIGGQEKALVMPTLLILCQESPSSVQNYHYLHSCIYKQFLSLDLFHESYNICCRKLDLLLWQIYQEVKYLFLYKKHLTKDKTISLKRLSKIGSLNLSGIFPEK